MPYDWWSKYGVEKTLDRPPVGTPKRRKVWAVGATVARISRVACGGDDAEEARWRAQETRRLAVEINETKTKMLNARKAREEHQRVRLVATHELNAQED